ncbi:MAG: ClpXP protease specificity-enhancing factor SspB [Holosporaceae bacterium]|nr:ClpXP protease specificity-enhancing factor SspB [Holosporaceae bacterium]
MSYLRYDELVQNALITVVKDVLLDVAKNGLMGDHHFYIRFRTDHPGAKAPHYLKERHPEEVMIVIQYQFWNLRVESDRFSVDLSFNGTQETLVVPFSSLTAFVDPSVKFALQFTPKFDEPGFPGGPGGGPGKGIRGKNVDVIEKTNPAAGSDEKIISLDSFRKK